MQTVDRTTPLLQQMDAIQTAHSRLYDNLRDGEKPFKSRVRFLDRNEDALEERDMFFDIGEEPRPMRDAVQDLACRASAVFTGTVQRAVSFPIADGTFLFTDYTVVIQDVLRYGTAQTLRPGQGTIVTRLGGRVEVGGTTRRALMADLPLLSEGQQYLFFAKYLPVTRDFEANAPTSAFLTDGKVLKALRSRDEFIFRQAGGTEPTAETVYEEIRKLSCQ